MPTLRPVKVEDGEGEEWKTSSVALEMIMSDNNENENKKCVLLKQSSNNLNSTSYDRNESKRDIACDDKENSGRESKEVQNNGRISAESETPAEESSYPTYETSEKWGGDPNNNNSEAKAGTDKNGKKSSTYTEGGISNRIVENQNNNSQKPEEQSIKMEIDKVVSSNNVISCGGSSYNAKAPKEESGIWGNNNNSEDKNRKNSKQDASQPRSERMENADNKDKGPDKTLLEEDQKVSNAVKIEILVSEAINNKQPPAPSTEKKQEGGKRTSPRSNPKPACNLKEAFTAWQESTNKAISNDDSEGDADFVYLSLPLAPAPQKIGLTLKDDDNHCGLARVINVSSDSPCWAVFPRHLLGVYWVIRITNCNEKITGEVTQTTQIIPNSKVLGAELQARQRSGHRTVLLTFAKRSLALGYPGKLLVHLHEEVQLVGPLPSSFEKDQLIGTSSSSSKPISHDKPAGPVTIAKKGIIVSSEPVPYGEPGRSIYHDWSNVPDSVPFIATGGVVIPFPETVMTMLDKISTTHSEIVSWLPHGRAFRVNDVEAFTSTILCIYFKQTKWASFCRQLGWYGFRKIHFGLDKGGHYNELFLRGRPSLCMKIQREAVKGRGWRKPADPMDEPNFYYMPALPPLKTEVAAAADQSASQLQMEVSLVNNNPQQKSQLQHSLMSNMNQQHLDSQQLLEQQQALVTIMEGRSAAEYSDYCARRRETDGRLKDEQKEEAIEGKKKQRYLQTHAQMTAGQIETFCSQYEEKKQEQWHGQKEVPAKEEESMAHARLMVDLTGGSSSAAESLENEDKESDKRARDRERKALSRANMNDEQKETMRVHDRERIRNIRAHWTDEQLETHRAQNRESMRKRRACMTDEQLEARRSQDREKKQLQRSQIMAKAREAMMDGPSRERYQQTLARMADDPRDEKHCAESDDLFDESFLDYDSDQSNESEIMESDSFNGAQPKMSSSGRKSQNGISSYTAVSTVFLTSTGQEEKVSVSKQGGFVYLTLPLPPMPHKIGLSFEDDRNYHGLPLLKAVSPDSPIGTVIPAYLVHNYWVIGIKDNELGNAQISNSYDLLAELNARRRTNKSSLIEFTLASKHMAHELSTHQPQERPIGGTKRPRQGIAAHELIMQRMGELTRVVADEKREETKVRNCEHPPSPEKAKSREKGRKKPTDEQKRRKNAKRREKYRKMRDEMTDEEKMALKAKTRKKYARRYLEEEMKTTG